MLLGAVARALAVVLVLVVVLPHDASAYRHHEGHLNRALGMTRRSASATQAYPDAKWFTQRLDHFDPLQNATWQQRYWVNDTFFRTPDGPVFVFIGGEGPLTGKAVVDYQVSLYAQQYGALVLALEHRFYGQSQPTADLSTDNLRYLSSEQALADLAYFREAMNEQYGNGDATKWVTFGGSYPGSLSAWFRVKYPHLAVGAVSSSGPVFAELNFFQYLQVVQASLLKSKNNGAQCVANIRSAFAVVQDRLVNGGQAGANWVQQTFQACTPFSGDMRNYANFMSNLMGNFMGTVQYNAEIPGQPTIDDICANMTSGTDAVAALAAVNAMYLALGDQKCVQTSYNDMVNELRDTSTSDQVGGRQWYYQTCTEFGYFQSTDAPSNTQPFGSLVPNSFWVQSCRDIFPELYESCSDCPLIDWTNAYYGGRQPRGTNIIFVNGSLDPWHALSVLDDLSETETAIYIDGTAHCANMHVWTPQYPPGMLVAQKQIAATIGLWLA